MPRNCILPIFPILLLEYVVIYVASAVLGHILRTDAIRPGSLEPSCHHPCQGCIMQEEGIPSPDDETALLVPCLAHIKVVPLPLVPSDVHLVPIAYSEKLNRMSVEGHVVLEDPQ